MILYGISHEKSISESVYYGLWLWYANWILLFYRLYEHWSCVEFQAFFCFSFNKEWRYLSIQLCLWKARASSHHFNNRKNFQWKLFGIKAISPYRQKRRENIRYYHKYYGIFIFKNNQFLNFTIHCYWKYAKERWIFFVFLTNLNNISFSFYIYHGLT